MSTDAARNSHAEVHDACTNFSKAVFAKGALDAKDKQLIADPPPVASLTCSDFVSTSANRALVIV